MKKERVAVYAGSFNPFTKGHESVVTTALMVFDRVIILFAVNSDKATTRQMNSFHATKKYYGVNDRVCVDIYNGLVAEYCLQNDYSFVVRGLRNTSDYLYEENIAKVNAEINPSLRTIYLRAENECISSSMVRELTRYGQDVQKYLPYDVAELDRDPDE